jgi:hypothetical protein
LEDRQGPNIQEEGRVLNIIKEEIEYNEHEEIMKSLELVETIRSLKIEVQR